MFDPDKWEEILHAMKMNKLRTFLTGLGVSWGIFMLLVLMGAGSGLFNGATADFGNFATNSMVLWTQSTSKAYKGLPEGRGFEMQNSDAGAIMRQVEGVELAAPRVQLGGYRGQNEVVRKKFSGVYQVMGEIPEVIRIQPKVIASGRFINEKDLVDKRKVCVIGTGVRDVLFEPWEEPIGDFIKINGISFRVVGVFDLDFGGRNAQDQLETIIVPLTAFQQAFNKINEIGWFSILAKDGVKIADIEPEVLAVLKARHKVHPDDPRAFGSWNAQEEMDKINGVFIGIQMLVWFVGIGTLIAGVIGVSNIMLVVVKERTREIGVRKALGATPYSVVSQVVIEAIYLTTMAGSAGLLFGVLLVEGLANLMRSTQMEVEMFSRPEINFEAALYATIILIVAGALAGLMPAYRAASVNPIVALRGN